ncbi:MAG: ABC transporter substrate-binding protein [Lachnospiraceae bacterium]|nr:ABC transporter substrate-binding protein [Lachnospiraceae bacterium]
MTFMIKILLLILCLSLSACGAKGQASQEPAASSGASQAGAENNSVASGEAKAATFSQLQWEKGMELSHAATFFVEKAEEYYLITIADTDKYLLVPENETAPKDVPKDVCVLQKPLDHAYLASSSVFDLLREAGALGSLRFSGTKKEDLCIDAAISAMENGELLYAGKYSKPDYELLLAERCDLAIENTMIYHNPEAKEKLESLGIPVLVETSSYEEHPFGRLEWIKLYGLLFDHLEEAERFYDEKIASLTPVLQQENTGLKVAFFYVNSNGVVNVRKPGDYVAKMISLAGGEYVLTQQAQEEENALSTMNMQMEDFYLAAKDADLIIYNSTIVGELKSIDELKEISPVFADFKAVKEGRVYCTAKNFFQETTAIADFVADLSDALRNPTQTQFSQLIKIN